MMHELYKYLLELLRNIPVLESLAKPISAFTVILTILVIARLLHFTAKKIILKIAHRVVQKTAAEWDDILVRKKVFNGVAHLIPLFFIYSSCFFAAPSLEKPLAEFPLEILTTLKADYYFQLGPVLLKFARIYFIFTVVYILITLLNASNEIYQSTPYAPHRSIKGYIQLAQILVIFMASILVVSVLIGKDPTVLFAGLGAMAAVLMLVFKDTILGFVASIQLSANHMLKIGDWIEMPARNADGTVIDITLTTVKIQNWDKTITTVPTWSLVSESFTNWIGMVEAEGRRIKRFILIDILSIRICTQEMLKHLGKIELISEVVRSKEKEISLFHKPGMEGDHHTINSPGLTNIGIFRIYLELYLKNHPGINQKMDIVVRQLQSGDKGVPLEIIAFSKIKGWAEFENIQSGIFDHIFSVLPEFGLKAFQSPTGYRGEIDPPLRLNQG
jgi:miniconductance mechanosensitive channel